MKNRKNKVICLFVLMIAIVFSLSACGKTDGGGSGSASGTQESSQAANDDSLEREEITNGSNAAAGEITDAAARENEAESDADEGNSAAASGSKILIAYFTAAENSGVDAVSSASYSIVNDEAVGRVRAVADMISKHTGGELFSIRTSTVYPADIGELIDYAADEQDDNLRPELISHIENLENYDVVFVGFPTWWYDMPMALYSFFEEYDFSGKTIIPFNVHNGSRFSGTISTIQSLEPDASVIEDGFTVSERDVADAGNDVEDWLESLGY